MIRTVPPGEALPEGTPARYASSHGYVRLRWHVGPDQYIECYEHRAVMGNPPRGFEVHHIDRCRSNNAPENLVVLTVEEHHAVHNSLRPPNLTVSTGYRGRAAKKKHARSVARKIVRSLQDEGMARLYGQGLGTVEIGERYGLHHSQVSRRLRKAGVNMRPAGKHNTARRTA